MHIAAPAAGRLRFSDGTTMAASTTTAGIPRAMLSAAFRRRCAVTPSLASRGEVGVRVAPTHAITEACLADPSAFVAAWSAPRAVDGADVLDQTARTDAVHFIETKVMDRPPTQFPTIDDRPVVVSGPVVVAGPIAHGGTVVDGGPVLADPIAHGKPSGRRASRIPHDPIVDDRIDGQIDDLLDDPVLTGRSLASKVRASLDPRGSIAAMLDARVTGLPADRDHQAPPGLPAQPVFTTPMYARLATLNPEFLLPGVGGIPDDTVALAEVNHAFVESFLAGLNHELGREFLWREYPAQLSDTWFHRFWDSVDGTADIVDIGEWKPSTLLGSHQPKGHPTASLVLLVTGALMRRYPDTKVYAVEATRAGSIAPRQEDTSAEADVRLPLFTGNLGPGIRFFGFDLDEETARGSSDPPRHPGYFFVFEEQPHAPRFGFDAPDSDLVGTVPDSWTSMSWSHLVPRRGKGQAPTFVDLDARPQLETAVDKTWGDYSAAMANIAFQRPVRMLVHADCMLPAPSLPGGVDPHIDPDFDPTDPFGGGPFDPIGPRSTRPRRRT
jgi:hypothetical protein